MSIAAAGLTETHPQRQLIDPAPRLQGGKLVANHIRILPRRNIRKSFCAMPVRPQNWREQRRQKRHKLESAQSSPTVGSGGPNLRADVGDHFKKDAKMHKMRIGIVRRIKRRDDSVLEGAF
jgi:hypothetical protein